MWGPQHHILHSVKYQNISVWVQSGRSQSGLSFTCCTELHPNREERAPARWRCAPEWGQRDLTGKEEGSQERNERLIIGGGPEQLRVNALNNLLRQSFQRRDFPPKTWQPQGDLLFFSACCWWRPEAAVRTRDPALGGRRVTTPALETRVTTPAPDRRRATIRGPAQTPARTVDTRTGVPGGAPSPPYPLWAGSGTTSPPRTWWPFGFWSAGSARSVSQVWSIGQYNLIWNKVVVLTSLELRLGQNSPSEVLRSCSWVKWSTPRCPSGTIPSFIFTLIT